MSFRQFLAQALACPVELSQDFGMFSEGHPWRWGRARLPFGSYKRSGYSREEAAREYTKLKTEAFRSSDRRGSAWWL